jgi:hypothetical protein
MVSEESWKNRSDEKPIDHPCPAALRSGRRWIAVVVSRTHEAHGAARKLWTST